MPYDEEQRAANRARFARLVARPEPDIDLAGAALAIAADGRPEVDDESARRVLDGMAEHVRIRLDTGDPETEVVDRLHDVLYREAGFRPPSATAYQSARNSLLDLVVSRRVGLPISLAIVELEVGWRIGLDLVGVGLPGHFILRAPGGDYLDPAGFGRRLAPDDCQALLRRSLGDGVLFHAGMLRPVGRRHILARVLRNLRAAHLAARDWPAALGSVELMAVIEPGDPDHGRDRGLLLGRMGRFGEAVNALGQYLEERPDATDAGDVRQVIGIFAGRRN
jgi:regulator of sirC expression with transglutaminase-like and TPR domain